MSLDEHYLFYAKVAEYVQAHPECAAYVSDYVSSGLQRALELSDMRAADMEVALCVALTKRYKNGDAIIQDKLGKWKDKTSLNWSWITDPPAASE